jgi:preprotein translocase subunit SecB
VTDQNASTPAAPAASAPAATTPAQEGSAFQIEKIYMKDALFEQPNSPRIFLNQDKPTISVNINTASEKINDETYEVTVKGTIKGVIGDQVLFLAEVEQAGLFEIKNFPENQMAPALEVTCPTMIYPALRYNLADMMSRAGFQPINLTEISFRAIYEQRLADAKKKAEAEQFAATDMRGN